MNDIDCVILWVDGSDKKWLAQKNAYVDTNNKINEDAEAERYRDFGVLKYLFRGIETNMSWVRNIIFVTCGQHPQWLDKSNTKLRFVDHKDFIPEKYLPTFNSHTIEMNLHRIPELSDNFIYFNDDMFVIDKTKETDFFRNGLPCDSAVLNAIAMKKTEKEFRFLMPINDIEIINKYFSKLEVIKNNRWKYYNIKYGKDLLRTLCLTPWIHFTGFCNYHLPYSIQKKNLEEIWEREPEVLDQTCSHKFRNSNDVNIWLVLYWQYVTGRFTPRSPKIGYLTGLSDDKTKNQNVYNFIKNKKRKIIVINDEIKQNDFKSIKKEIIDAFDSILPDKSSFEVREEKDNDFSGHVDI